MVSYKAPQSVIILSSVGSISIFNDHDGNREKSLRDQGISGSSTALANGSLQTTHAVSWTTKF